MKRLHVWMIVLNVTFVCGFRAGKTYPELCSTTEEQAKREIPDVNDALFISSGVTLNLVHVTSIISEGIKTPSTINNCWPGYEDLIWDCSLSTLTSPPSLNAVEYLEDEERIGRINYGEAPTDPAITKTTTMKSGDNPMFLFEKRYDATYSLSGSDQYPKRIRNELQGTCELGQLTTRGFRQQRLNGILLRKAYVKSNTISLNQNKESSRILFDFDEEAVRTEMGVRVYDEPNLYFRSDDKSANLMSGMGLIQSFFGDLMKKHATISNLEKNPIIPVHMADWKKDVMLLGHDQCPALKEIESKALNSERYYLDYLHSMESISMKELGSEFMGGYHEDPKKAMECILTTTCLDRPIPYVLNYDESSNDENLTNRFGSDFTDRYISFQSQKAFFPYTFSYSRYAKIASNPLWNDILSGLLTFTDSNNIDVKEEWPDLREKSKLSVYSARDTTIMALLSSLGSTMVDQSKYPPYASMILIELYELDIPKDADADVGAVKDLKDLYPSGNAFRFIYNGEVMTPKISGCPLSQDLCSLEILILHVFEFADLTELDEFCEVENNTPLGDEKPDIHNKPREQLQRGARATEVVFTAFISFAVGALFMYFLMSKKSHHPVVVSTHERDSLELEPHETLVQGNDIEPSPRQRNSSSTKSGLYELAQMNPII